MTALPKLGLTGSLTQSAAPFTFGQAFVQGTVPAGSNAVAPNAQVVPKNKWPDGSLKFAIVSGTAPLTANVPTMLKFTLGTPPAESALTAANLAATKMSASISAGAFGTVVWNSADWSTPFMVWVSGPEMSSWIYRKAIGTDAHLVGWLEVRLYKSGAVEILPWIENGYLNVAAPINKSATYSFVINGVERFSAAIDLPNHCRTPLVSGTALSYWLGADPAVTPSHGGSLQLTALVPTYGAKANAATLARQVQAYAPLQQGNYPVGMGAAGFHPSIGILPEWDVAYLTTDDARAYKSVVINGFSAGRYGTHHRDETTQRPIRFSSYPNLAMGTGAGVPGIGGSTKASVAPASKGTVPPTYNSTHHPSIGYVAYLVTGRFYFMEEVQFVATANYLKNQNAIREFSNGVFLTTSGSNTVRGAAWAFRTLVQAACATPDNDLPLRSELLASVEANVNYYHKKYIAPEAQPNSFGIVAPYGNYTSSKGYYSVSPWQQDFFTAAYGYCMSLNLPLSADGTDKLRSFFVWKAQSVIGRLGNINTKGEWPYTDAAPYYMPASPLAGTPNWDSPNTYYASWQEMYDRLEIAPTGAVGNLRGGNYPEASSYWGNLQPAIAYAVEHKVAGADAAYARLTSAPNYGLLKDNLATAIPWAVTARAGANLGEVVTPPVLPPAVPPIKTEPPIAPPINANFTITLPAPKGGSLVTTYKITMNDGTVLEQMLPNTGKPMRLRVIIEEQL